MKRNTGKIRVVLADDHAVLRAGIRMLINAQPDMEVVGEAADGKEAIERAKTLSPDLLLLDLSMPGAGGLSVLQLLKESTPRTKVLILTMHDDDTYLRQVLSAGASGYVVKKAADMELLAAIRAVHRGEIYVHSSMTGALLEPLLNNRGERTVSAPAEDLSERERQVLLRLAQGHTNQQIADELLLSVKTIETYRARVMEKLRLKTRADLVRYALRRKLLTPDL